MRYLKNLSTYKLHTSYTDRGYRKEDTYTLWGQKDKGHVTFDLLLKSFHIGYNFFILRDRAFIFGMCVPYDKTIPPAP